MCNNSVPAGQKCIFCWHVSRGVSYSVSAPTSQIWNWFFFRGFFCFSILVKFPSNFFCLEMISTHKLPSRADLLLRLFEHICLKRSAFRRIPSILIGGGGTQRGLFKNATQINRKKFMQFLLEPNVHRPKMHTIQLVFFCVYLHFSFRLCRIYEGFICLNSQKRILSVNPLPCCAVCPVVFFLFVYLSVCLSIC